MKYTLLVIVATLNLAGLALADSFDPCKDVIIDQVTEMAFGEQGLPYTGKIVCYYDEDKTRLKSKRIFDKGIPIGSHICVRYSYNNEFTMDIEYVNGKRRNFKRWYSDSREELKEFVRPCKKSPSRKDYCAEFKFDACE